MKPFGAIATLTDTEKLGSAALGQNGCASPGAAIHGGGADRLRSLPITKRKERHTGR